MVDSHRPSVSMFLAALLGLNVLTLALIFLERPALPVRAAAGAPAGVDGSGFRIATEHGADNFPVCFVLDARDNAKPHLAAYRTNVQGHLQLSSAREIACDLRITDYQTQPPVLEICKTVKRLEGKEGEKEKGKKPEEGEEKKKEGSEKK